MGFNGLNRSGYAVIGFALLAIGAGVAGEPGYAALFVLLSAASLRAAMRRNRRHDADVYPHDRDPDHDERRKRREGELEGDKGRGSGLG